MLTLIEFTKELSFLTLLKAKKYKVKYSVMVVWTFFDSYKTRKHTPIIFNPFKIKILIIPTWILHQILTIYLSLYVFIPTNLSLFEDAREQNLLILKLPTNFYHFSLYYYQSRSLKLSATLTLPSMNIMGIVPAGLLELT